VTVALFSTLTEIAYHEKDRFALEITPEIMLN